jgi:hypothetical protein
LRIARVVGAGVIIVAIEGGTGETPAAAALVANGAIGAVTALVAIGNETASATWCARVIGTGVPVVTG